MSFEGVFDEFDEEEKREKTVPKESTEPSKTPVSEAVPIPEEGKEDKDGAEEEAPSPSEEKGVDGWFGEPVEKTVEERSIEKGTDEERAEETPSEEPPAIATPAVVDDDWFTPAEEEPASDKPAEDKPVEEDVAGDTPAEESPAEETPAEATDDWFMPSEDQTPIEIPTEVSVDRGSLVGIKASPIVRQAVSAEAMKEQMRQFQNLKASLLDKSDIATIQNKPFIKRSGWRKLALAFNLSDEIVKEEKEVIGDEFEWRIWVKVWAPNGRFATGIGGCCSDERDFAHLRHDVYATAHTRAKNRALSDLIGSGEVSWEELRGMG